ncbi:homoserine dehydrogenase [Alteribacter populi]|uniref:homoserine dehydrogenase n=1 Tax=Alteribacter populi TaxID=2011011 RepID=UPI000BBB445F|nr:homoserine dehydrogenase [Alteribacter populi]
MSGKAVKLAIIGFGTVGEGVYQTIVTKQEKLVHLLGRQLEVPVVLVKDGTKKREVAGNTKVTMQSEEVFRQRFDLVVEATPDANTGYPYVTAFLKRGTSVVTANKELVAKHGEELYKLADENNCQLLFEAAVAGGIPLLNTLRHTLKTNSIQKVNGILNGTSNYVLTKMKGEGASFNEALKEAQEKGYAEAVPDKDVDGWDAYYKTTILSHWIYGKAPIWNKTKPVGVRNIRIDDLNLAEKVGGKIKHVASLEKVGEHIRAAVRPCFVFEKHPLYSVDGVNNGVHIEGSIVGDILLQGPGAGKYPTSSAVIEDVVNFLQNKNEKKAQDVANTSSEKIDEGSIVKNNAQYWFLSGSDGLTRHLSVCGIRIVVSVQETGLQSKGCIVSADDGQLDEFMRSYSANVQTYPILANEEEILQYPIKDGVPAASM